MNVTNVPNGKSASMPNKEPLIKRDPFWTERDATSYITGKMVGGNIPLPLSEYLNLLAAYYELSIQGVLQRIIKEWCEDREPVVGILETLVDRALMEWTRRLSAGADGSQIMQMKYLEEVKVYLGKHKINNKGHVNQIISDLKAQMELTV